MGIEMEMNKFKESYEIGLPIRKKLTEEYSMHQLKELMYAFDDIARQLCNIDFSETRIDEKLNLEYGSEKNTGLEYEPSVDFILKEITLTYGSYDYYKININCLGIFVSYKGEHEIEKNVLSIYWTTYNNFKRQHLDIFP
jgi:hypothetical protein